MPDVLTLITLITCLNYELSLFPLPFCINTFRPLLLEGLNCPYELGLPSLFVLSADTLSPPFKPYIKAPSTTAKAVCEMVFSPNARSVCDPIFSRKINDSSFKFKGKQLFYFISLVFPPSCPPLLNSWPFYCCIIMFMKGIYLVLVY